MMVVYKCPKCQWEIRIGIEISMGAPPKHKCQFCNTLMDKIEDKETKPVLRCVIMAQEHTWSDAEGKEYKKVEIFVHEDDLERLKPHKPENPLMATVINKRVTFLIERLFENKGQKSD